MTCEIERPDPQDLFDHYKGLFQNTVLGGADVIPESNEWYAIAVNYAMAEHFYAITEQAYKERDCRYACEDNLLDMAAQDGLFPRDAVPAQGYVQLRGVPNTALPTTLEFTIADTDFVIAENSALPPALDAVGRAVVRVRAVTPGSLGNVVAEEGEMTTEVVDVNQTVCACTGSFCNGSDAESIESFRQRYCKRMTYKPRATMDWIMDKFMEWPCVERVAQRGGSCCECSDCGTAATGSASGSCSECGCADCGGKMNFYVMFRGGECDCNDLQNEQVLGEIEEWMFGSPQGYGLGQVEMGICGRVVPYTAVPVNIEVDIDECVTGTQLATIHSVVEEFFETVEPSQPVNSDQIRLSLVRALGINNVEVSMTLTSPAQGYGPLGSGGSETDPGKDVYVTACGLEPDCDYMLSINNIHVTQNAGSVGSCP